MVTIEAKITKLDHYRLRDIRGILNSRQEQADLRYLTSGDAAETKLYNTLKSSLPNHFIHHRNIWLKDNQTTEIDIITITDSLWVLIDVKNYTGHFEYKNNKCYKNGEEIRNEVAAAGNREAIVRRIANNHGHKNITIISALIFMNEDCVVHAEEQNICQIIRWHEVSLFIKEITNLNQQLKTTIATAQAIKTLAQYQIPYPITFPKLTDDTFEKIKKGFHCPKCNSYQVEIHYKFIQCKNCRHPESKAEATTRSAIDLGALYYHQPQIITTQNIHKLLNNQISPDAIKRILPKTLTPLGNGRARHYHNPTMPYDKIKHLYNFKITRHNK